MQFVDSHCHLTYPRDDGVTPQDLVNRALSEHVVRMLTISTSHSTFKKMHDFTCATPQVYCTYGIHPHEAGKELSLEALEKEIRQAVIQPKVVGLGEAGLDYHYNYAPKEAQKEEFRLHLKMSQELDVPLVIHTREAEEDTIDILTEALERGPLKAVIHCFTSKKVLADFAIEAGLYLGMTGVVTFKRSQDLRDIFAEVPLNKILIETDSPYLAPVPFRGKPNQPAFIPHIAECLADIKKCSIEEIADQTTENFYQLFKRVPKESVAK